MGMRAIVLAIVAIHVRLGHPARAEDHPAADRSIRELLPLVDQNHCETVKDPADQLFCGDPELSDAAAKLSSAIENRLNRIPNRRLAIEENAEWIRDRNSSCGIFGNQNIPNRDVKSIASCLLKETRERIAILDDPNFDCLASNTTAGMLICSDPALAIADRELNGHVVALIAKMKDDEAKEACLADDMSRRTAEIIAAKGDPKQVFGKSQLSPSPDADAVDLCIAQIHSANACGDFLRVSRIIQLDTE